MSKPDNDFKIDPEKIIIVPPIIIKEGCGIGFLPVILVLALIAILFSCKSHKDLSKESTEIALTQTITEQVDTTIKTKEVTAEASKELEKLIEGDSAFTDTPELTITTKIVKGRVKTIAKKKAQEIPVKINKTTVTHFKQAVHKKEVHKEVKPCLAWLWWLLLIPAFLIWRFRRDIFHIP